MSGPVLSARLQLYLALQRQQWDEKYGKPGEPYKWKKGIALAWLKAQLGDPKAKKIYNVNPNTAASIYLTVIFPEVEGK